MHVVLWGSHYPSMFPSVGALVDLHTPEVIVHVRCIQAKITQISV
jgi:tRNA(Ser,Leu) C12 N-acetylase TAN1